MHQVTCLVFIFGFGGFLAAWSGLYQPSGPDDPGNTILFSLLNSQGQQVRLLYTVLHHLNRLSFRAWVAWAYLDFFITGSQAVY